MQAESSVISGWKQRPMCGPCDHGDRVVAESGDNLGLRSGALDQWRPDEHRAKRRNAQRRNRDVSLERLDLPSIAVAADADVENPERDLIGRPSSTSRLMRIRPAHVESVGIPAARRSRSGISRSKTWSRRLIVVELAARKDERIDALELGGCPHRGCLRAAAAECREVLPDVALQGEDAYPKDGQFPLSGRERSVPGGAGFASFAHL